MYIALLVVVPGSRDPMIGNSQEKIRKTTILTAEAKIGLQKDDVFDSLVTIAVT
jgi:hypothetical protein